MSDEERHPDAAGVDVVAPTAAPATLDDISIDDVHAAVRYEIDRAT